MSSANPADWPLVSVRRHSRRNLAPTAEPKPLPLGCRAWRTCADLHNVPRRTIENAIQRGDIPALRAAKSESGWREESGQPPWAILESEGQRRPYEHYHSRLDSHTCPACPHELPAAPERERLAGPRREMAPTLPSASGAWRIPLGKEDDDAGEE
jgi:hypothetical protein